MKMMWKWMPTSLNYSLQAEEVLARVNALQEQMWCYSESGAPCCFLAPSLNPPKP